MTYKTLTLLQQNGVAWVNLNRPEVFNALNLECARELDDLAQRVSNDSMVRVVVLTGAGEAAFCAGGDVREFASAPQEIGLHLKDITRSLHSAISCFAWMSPPLIAMVNGVVAGGGIGLVAAADLVVASETATFTSSYTRIGLTPDGSSSYYLPRLIGHRRAMELFLTNRKLSAREALDWGLVNDIVPRESLREKVSEIAATLAAGPLRAHGGIKKLLRLSALDSLESHMERESREIMEMSRSRDGVEGVRAFTERRTPRFEDR